jgi:hypothetical protein
VASDALGKELEMASEALASAVTTALAHSDSSPYKLKSKNFSMIKIRNVF